MHKTSKWAQIVIHANGYISICMRGITLHCLLLSSVVRHWVVLPRVVLCCAVSYRAALCCAPYLSVCLAVNLPTSISAYLLQLGSHGCQQQRHRMQTSREGVVPSIATPLTDSPVCIQKYRHTHISTYVHGLQKATQHETE